MIDGFAAGQTLVRACIILGMFLFFLIIFQFIVGETVGIVRDEDDQPRAFWTILGIETAAVGLLILFTYLHTH